MTRYIKVKCNFLTTTPSATTCFVTASLSTGANYDIEYSDSGIIWDTYCLAIHGEAEEISQFISYLKMKGLNVEVF